MSWAVWCRTYEINKNDWYGSTLEIDSRPSMFDNQNLSKENIVIKVLSFFGKYQKENII